MEVLIDLESARIRDFGKFVKFFGRNGGSFFGNVGNSRAAGGGGGEKADATTAEMGFLGFFGGFLGKGERGSLEDGKVWRRY